MPSTVIISASVHHRHARLCCLEKIRPILPPTIHSLQRVAAKIVEPVGTHLHLVTDLSVNGPGFVHCRLRLSFLQQHVNAVLIAGGTLPMPVVLVLREARRLGLNILIITFFNTKNRTKMEQAE